MAKEDFVWRESYGQNSEIISSLSEYLQYVEVAYHYFHSEIWFRGHAKSTFPLIPGVYRNDFTLLDDTDYPWEFYYDYIRRASALGVSGDPSEWNWYYTMQHHGLPTRLLDWTEGSLIALYFAVRDLLHSVNDSTTALQTPCVWVLEPYALNMVTQADMGDQIDNIVYDTDELAQSDDWRTTLNYVGNSKLPRLPIAIRPPYFLDRLAVQRSVFTVHGSLKDGLKVAHRSSDEKFLIRLRIRTGAAFEILSELALAGISETTFFPDLEGLAREMKSEHHTN